MYYLRYFIHESKRARGLLIQLSFQKRTSQRQPVTYIVNVVLTRKQCQMESLLLQITNEK